VSKPWTFQELATKAHDMKVTIANRCNNSFGFVEPKNNNAEFKRNVKFFKSSTKEEMSISNSTSLDYRNPKLEDQRSAPFKDAMSKHTTLKEL